MPSEPGRDMTGPGMVPQSRHARWAWLFCQGAAGYVGLDAGWDGYVVVGQSSDAPDWQAGTGSHVKFGRDLVGAAGLVRVGGW